MMHGVDSVTAMNNELRIRCAAAGMPFECGAGGLLNASIAVIAEAPGDREVQQRAPLVGGSGRVLWECLRREGLTRTQVYITNVVKRKLVQTEDDSGKSKAVVGRNELDHWFAILHEELALLPNVRIVVALGNYALEALTGQTGITAWRGSVQLVRIAGREVHVIPTFNPAAIIREPRTEVTFRHDLHKITRVVNGTWSPPQITEHINPTFAEAMDYIHECHHTGGAVAYDIETTNGETACIGLANRNTEGMCINFRDAMSNRFTLSQEADIRRALQAMLGDPTVELIAQNGMYDASWLWFKDRIRVHGHWFDTMLAHHLLYPPLPHGLGYLTSQYTDMPYYKDEGKTWREDGDIDQWWRYNVKDCVATRMCAFAMHKELREQGLEAFFFEHVMQLQPHLVRMTVGGVKADMALKGRFVEEVAQDVERKRLAFIESTRVATGNPSYEINPNSPVQLGRLFFGDLRLVGRGASTDDENRERMLKHPRTSPAAREMLLALGAYKEDAKFLSTYAEMTVDDDNRFRSEYKQTGVKSAPGRLSSAQTPWGTGGNLQNIPERAKPMVVSDTGYMFSYFDMAQIEARIVGWLANIVRWKEQFERARLEPGSYDAHCALASDMFKVPYDEVPKHDFEPGGGKTIRFTAKRCRHGLNYRMGPPRLATTAGLPLPDAEEAYRLYHSANPEIMAWWDDTIATVRRDRCLVSPLGRRWVLLERFDEDALDSIIAFAPQSAAGDKVASVIYKAERHPLWPRDARIVLNIHDALIALHRVEDGDIVRAIMRHYAEEPLVIRGEPLIIPADFAVSVPDEQGLHRWSTLKKIKEVEPLESVSRRYTQVELPQETTHV